MDFLLRAMRKNRRRLKFEQWLLLATRCLLVFLMGMALARPLGCENQHASPRSAGAPASTSSSSTTATRWPTRPAAPTPRPTSTRPSSCPPSLIDRLAAGNEEVMIITASSPIDQTADRPPRRHAQADLRPPVRPRRDRPHRAVLRRHRPRRRPPARHPHRQGREQAPQPSTSTSSPTAPRSAFEGAGGKAVDALKQTGAELARHFTRPNLFALGKPGQWNQAVLDVAPAVQPRHHQVLRRLRHPRQRLRRRPRPHAPVEDERRARRPVPSPSSSTPRPSPSPSPARPSPRAARTSSPSPSPAHDRLKVDNTRWRVVDVASEMKVLIVEGDRGIGALAGSGSFLELALVPAQGSRSRRRPLRQRQDRQLRRPRAPDRRARAGQQDPHQLPRRLPHQRRPDQPQPGRPARAIRRAGGHARHLRRPRRQQRQLQPAALPRGLLPGRLIKTVSTNDNAFHFDFNPKGNLHPFLREFKDQENTGLATAQIWSYWQLELPANTTAKRVLDYQAQGPDKPKDPAVTVHPLGRGRVVFFSTTANPEWNGLTPKPVYVALMHEILAGSVGAADSWMNLTVGDRSTSPRPSASPPPHSSSTPPKMPILVEAVDRSGRASPPTTPPSP